MSERLTKPKRKISNRERQRNAIIGKIIRIIILLIMCAFALFPVVWVVSASLNPNQSMQNQSLIPDLERQVLAGSVGTINSIEVTVGDRINEGDLLATITTANGESADVLSPINATVTALDLAVGDTVERSTAIMTLEGVARNLLVNYDELISTERYPFFRWVFNSVVVSSITSVITVFITAMSAYSFSRFRFRGRQSLLVTILLVQVFPNLLAMVAIFLILQQIGTYIPFLGLSSLGGLILVYVGGGMGINIWLMKGFFDSIPRDIDESAMVDGASHWQAYWLLILPLVRPILVVVGILSFVGTFNEFVLARVLLRGDNQSWTLMVGLWGFIADSFAQNWGIFAAGAVIGSLPTLIIYLLLQDQIVGGLTQGAVKG